MNPLTAVWRSLTYRTEHSTPDPAAGLTVTNRGWGARTVYDPRVPALLEARRRRVLRDGLDPIDRALLDPATVLLLAATAASMPGTGLLPTDGGPPQQVQVVQAVHVSDGDRRRIAGYVARYLTAHAEAHADHRAGSPPCGGQLALLEGARR